MIFTKLYWLTLLLISIVGGILGFLAGHFVDKWLHL